MKTSTYFALPLVFVLMAFSSVSQSESKWSPSPPDMVFYLDYDCDDVPDVLVGNFINHSIEHFIKSENNPVWSKMQGHGEFRSEGTGEMFKVIAITNSKGLLPAEPLHREQHFTLIGNMGTHMLLTRHTTMTKNPDGPGYIIEITKYAIKCL